MPSAISPEAFLHDSESGLMRSKGRIGLVSVLIACLFGSVLFVACDSDDPTEAVSFRPGYYNGIYKTITNYSHSGQEIAIDSVTFEFKDSSPDNLMFMRLDANRDSDRDHCDWDCTWILYSDSMRLDTTDSQPNTICDHLLSPEATYKYFVDGRYIIFYVYDDAHPYDLYRYFEIYVP